MTSSRMTVVIATRDRRGEPAHTLRRLRALPERPEIIVVDNDGTAEAVRAAFPDVRLGALATAVDVFDAHPRLGLIAAMPLVGEERRPDPIVSRMAVQLPSPIRDSPEHRRGLEQRNELLTAWMRRPMPVALARTLRLAARTPRSAGARAAWPSALVRLPAALHHRRRLPVGVERNARLLETA